MGQLSMFYIYAYHVICMAICFFLSTEIIKKCDRTYNGNGKSVKHVWHVTFLILFMSDLNSNRNFFFEQKTNVTMTRNHQKRILKQLISLL
jgi:hypothetical protein